MRLRRPRRLPMGDEDLPPGASVDGRTPKSRQRCGNGAVVEQAMSTLPRQGGTDEDGIRDQRVDADVRRRNPCVVVDWQGFADYAGP